MWRSKTLRNTTVTVGTVKGPEVCGVDNEGRLAAVSAQAADVLHTIPDYFVDAPPETTPQPVVRRLVAIPMVALEPEADKPANPGPEVATNKPKAKAKAKRG